MRKPVRERLSACLDDATKAERSIASYMLANLTSLPFETASTVAAKIGLSEPSVGRFCRSIGYRHFKELKADLKADIGDAPWLIGDRLKNYRERSRRGNDELARGLDMEIAALVSNYELARTKEWKRAVKRLTHVPDIFVAGFQTERGLAHYLVNQLNYLRPNVHLVDLTGNFSDVLLGNPGKVNLIIIEARRYSRLARLLAVEARATGIATTLITDSYCDWAHDLVDEVFSVQTDLNQFWESTAPVASLLSLLINSIFNELGPAVEQRMNKVSGLYSHFIGHVGDPVRPEA